jgi:hypothetical protein
MSAPQQDTRTIVTATPMTDATKLFAEVNTKYVQAWVAGAEGALKAAFELQNASLTAMSAFVDAALAGQRSALR